MYSYIDWQDDDNTLEYVVIHCNTSHNTCTLSSVRNMITIHKKYIAILDKSVYCDPLRHQNTRAARSKLMKKKTQNFSKCRPKAAVAPASRPDRRPPRALQYQHLLLASAHAAESRGLIASVSQRILLVRSAYPRLFMVVF